MENVIAQVPKTGQVSSGESYFRLLSESEAAQCRRYELDGVQRPPAYLGESSSRVLPQASWHQNNFYSYDRSAPLHNPASQTVYKQVMVTTSSKIPTPDEKLSRPSNSASFSVTHTQGSGGLPPLPAQNEARSVSKTSKGSERDVPRRWLRSLFCCCIISTSGTKCDKNRSPISRGKVEKEATSSSVSSDLKAEKGGGEDVLGESGVEYTDDSMSQNKENLESHNRGFCHLLTPLAYLDKERYQHCLIVDLDETLVHSSFKPIHDPDFIIPVELDGIIHQVYVQKRPYVEEFLERIGLLFECVLFTASLAKYADPVADLLDPKKSIFRARLFREACVFHEGSYIKDLSMLGRDLKKVIIIDNSPTSYAFHPQNALPVSSWFDDQGDHELLALIPFLERLARVDNVYMLLGMLRQRSPSPARVPFANFQPSANALLGGKY